MEFTQTSDKELMVRGVGGSRAGRWREGIVRELGMDMHTLLYLKMDNKQGPTVFIAQGALLNVMWQPG